jgi:hypothetical protein
VTKAGAATLDAALRRYPLIEKLLPPREVEHA